MTAALMEDVTQRKTVINVMSITIAMAMNAAWMEYVILSMIAILVNVAMILIANLMNAARTMADADLQIAVIDQKIA